MAIEVGQKLLHYRLIEKIGEGGMGVVWKAEDTKLRRHVALKVLPETMAADPDRRARFEREARAVAALNHPNIVTLYSVEEADTSTGSVHFITMELVEGRTLTELLPRGGFPLRRLLEIATPLADAVASAHRAGVTHRDLKPDNIMIDGEGRLRVLDFGLAKLVALSEAGPAGEGGPTLAATVTSDTVAGLVLGTAAYMSPEQAEGKQVDARSDIFSLGVILYEMASGARPFQGDTAMSTIGAILKDEPSSVTELRPSLPRHAGRIIQRCLAKEPDRRYQTALDLRNELEQLTSEIDSGVQAPPPPGQETPVRRSRIPLVVGAVAVLGAALFLAAWLRDGADPAAPLYEPRPVTLASAFDRDVSWSPDGKFIAIERVVSGEKGIYVKAIDGGQAVARVELPGVQRSPRWTPDRRYLTFVSAHEAGNPIFLSPVEGGAPRRLVATQIPTLDMDSGVMGNRPWANDGRTLLIAKPSENGFFAVHAVDDTTGEATQITFPPGGSDDSFPTYSFDGEQILFRRVIDGRGALMLMSATGGDAEPLLQDEFNYHRGVWRPDNRRVVFKRSQQGGTAIENLFEIDVVTGQVRSLTHGTRRILSFSVSVDDRIVYTPFWHDQYFYVVDAATGEREQITSHAGDNWEPRFSPDGQTVAYSSTRTGRAEIWLHHRDGRAETRFTDNDHMERKPEWSPDGRRLLFVSDRDGGVPKLFVANTDGGTEPRVLVDQPIGWGTHNSNSTLSYNRVAQWSPDGETIAYRVIGEAGPELWTIGADGRNARKRLDEVTGFDWFLDDRRGLITRRRGTEDELLAVDLTSGRETPLFKGPLQELDVAPDGGAVAFCYGPGHGVMGLAVLKLASPTTPDGLPLAVGEPEYLVPTERTWHVHNVGWSPDSKSLLYVQDEDYGDVYELVRK